jgi:Domain of unknown function (DUF1905)
MRMENPIAPSLWRVDESFDAEVWFWRCRRPWHLLTVPPEICEALAVRSTQLSYGWGMTPVTAQIGRTSWKTSIFSKDGSYVVSVKTSARSAEGIELGDHVTVHLLLDG